MAYKPGETKSVCDICGNRGYLSGMIRTWNNLMVCPKCYDGPRSPLDLPPPLRPERTTVPDPRPRSHSEPTVLETVAVTSITDTTAASGGNITNNGGESVTAYGVCWAVTHAPDIDDDLTSDGTGVGTFVSALTGLTANTTYSVRAYATNAIGTSYGNEVTFTTTV